MKRKNGILAAVMMLTCCLIFRAGMTAGAAGTDEPGTAGDPLVSKSYLEKRIQETSGKSEGINVSYKKLTLQKGSSLTGDIGTEFILYAGNGTVIGKQGMINISTGELFKEKNSLTKYQVFLCTESGVGFDALSACTVYVRGKYKIR